MAVNAETGRSMAEAEATGSVERAVTTPAQEAAINAAVQMVANRTQAEVIRDNTLARQAEVASLETVSAKLDAEQSLASAETTPNTTAPEVKLSFWQGFTDRFTPTWAKRVMATATIAAAVAACGPAAPTANPTSIEGPSATPSALVSPSETPSPTATASPTEAPTPKIGGFEQTGNGFVWHGTNSETGAEVNLNVPDFNGTKPELVDGKIIYKDAKGETAEWKPNLSVDGKETGVFVVRADIVTAKTKAAHDAGKFQLAIPLDVRTISDNKDTTLTFGPSRWDTNNTGSAMIIELPKDSHAKLTTFNPYVYFAILTPGFGSEYNWSLANLIPDSVLAKIKITPAGNELNCTAAYGTSGGQIENVTPSYNKPVKGPIGDPVGDASGEISIETGSRQLGFYDSLTTSNILMDNETPIAIMANTV